MSRCSSQRRCCGESALTSPARTCLPRTPREKSALLLGASIIAVELPTAFPYFAALAAILGSGRPLAREIVLVGVYNLCFVLPLLAILATLLIAGDRADQILTSGREAVERRWPAVFAALLLLGGLALVAFGAVALATN